MCTVLVIALTAAAAQPKPFLVAADGQAKCVIAAPERLATAAEELAGWLSRMSGADFQVVTAPPLPSGAAMVLGTRADFPSVSAKLGMKNTSPEEVLLFSEPQRLWVLAAQDVGVARAVYLLLHELGCRWYFPHPAWHVIPLRRTLRVQISLHSQPAFRQREIWYEWGGSVPEVSREQFGLWARYNLQGGHFQFNCSHAYPYLVPASKYFQEHPEYFALVEGQRRPPQLCVSNPDVIRIASEAVVEQFRKNPNLNMVSVEPEDGGGYCECENCRKLGNHSDMTFWFAKQIAKRLREVFPNKWVGLYAYAYHSEPPKYRFEPNVYVQVTTGFRWTKLSFDEQVTAFRKLGATLGVYDYFSVYPWDFDIAGRAKASRVFELASAIRHYRDLGLSTYSAESSCNWGPCGPGYWMAARLMWDPDQSPAQLFEDFLRGAFEGAAEPMRRLYTRWALGERFSPRNLKLALLDLQEAYQREPSPAVRARLDQIAMYLHYLKLWRDYEVAAMRTEFGKLTVPDEELLRRAEAWTRWCRRLTDTGLIAVFPTLFTELYESRMASAMKIEGAKEKAADWKGEPTVEPTSEELRSLLDADLAALKDLDAVELQRRAFSEKLTPVSRTRLAGPAAQQVQPYPLFVEQGSHYFLAQAGEKFSLELRPLGGHSVQGQWRVVEVASGREVAGGEAKADKDQAVTISFAGPRQGLYRLDPPTGYWHVAQVGFGPRPLVVEASEKRPLQLWTPRESDWLWFYVPAGTKSFVIGILGGGWPDIRLRVRDGAGNSAFSSD
ncbi:MAG: DUF4838 domain-containing protein, partial [Armatimonadetes bacterium]|nr:DUF4838 domain-containing protein [Armatimonadota bacterium]